MKGAARQQIAAADVKTATRPRCYVQAIGITENGRRYTILPSTHPDRDCPRRHILKSEPPLEFGGCHSGSHHRNHCCHLIRYLIRLCFPVFLVATVLLVPLPGGATLICKDAPWLKAKLTIGSFSVALVLVIGLFILPRLAKKSS